jgi:hypothetical protein
MLKMPISCDQKPNDWAMPTANLNTCPSAKRNFNLPSKPICLAIVLQWTLTGAAQHMLPDLHCKDAKNGFGANRQSPTRTLTTTSITGGPSGLTACNPQYQHHPCCAKF